ncbi:MAG: DapH/DapD/GlmU-related protein [Clostridium sp.]|nr:DapH/DapD/GlmU-related protein [Clostridium sp.]
MSVSEKTSVWAKTCFSIPAARSWIAAASPLETTPFSARTSASLQRTTPSERRSTISKPIVLGKNVWIGAGAIVLPGVTIGDNSVVGAGAVVTRNIPANTVAAGNPARVLRSL